MFFFFMKKTAPTISPMTTKGTRIPAAIAPALLDLGDEEGVGVGLEEEFSVVGVGVGLGPLPLPEGRTVRDLEVVVLPTMLVTVSSRVEAPEALGVICTVRPE